MLVLRYSFFHVDQLTKANFVTLQVFGEEASCFPKIFLCFRSSSLGNSWSSERFTYYPGKETRASLLSLKAWQNEETCFQKPVSSFCHASMPCGNTKFFYRVAEAFFFLETKLETMLPVWQNWATLGKHARATGVSSFCQALILFGSQCFGLLL